MGERNITFPEGILFEKDQNGNKLHFGPPDNIEMDETKEPVDPKEMQYIPKQVKERLDATFVLYLRRMSRKRFIKKLMGKGVPRNVARLTAESVRESKGSYAETYLNILLRDIVIYDNKGEPIYISPIR